MGDVDPVLLLATTDETSRDVHRGRSCGAGTAATTRSSSAPSYDHARAVLEGLRRWGRQVALVIACYGPDDRDGLDFLRRAYSLHPSAKRAIAAIWGDFASTARRLRRHRPRARRARSCCGPSAAATRSSTARSPTRSTTGTSPRASASRRCGMIGEQRDERTHSLRDQFGRNHIPVGFHQVGTESANRLLAGARPRGPRAAGRCCSPSPPRRRRSSRRPTSRSPTPSG